MRDVICTDSGPRPLAQARALPTSSSLRLGTTSVVVRCAPHAHHSHIARPSALSSCGCRRVGATASLRLEHPHRAALPPASVECGAVCVQSIPNDFYEYLKNSFNITGFDALAEILGGVQPFQPDQPLGQRQIVRCPIALRSCRRCAPPRVASARGAHALIGLAARRRAFRNPSFRFCWTESRTLRPSRT